MQHAWIAPSLRRFFPSSAPEPTRSLRIDVARGERASFQAVFRTGEREAVIAAEVRAPDGFDVAVRNVGYVPVHHLATETSREELDGIDDLPGLAPDPLLPDSSVQAGAFETRSFWVSVSVPVDAEPTRQPIQVSLRTRSGDDARLVATLHVHRAVLPPRQDFPVTHWLYADAIADWYRVKLFSTPFWRILGPYLDDYAGHGSDTIYVPLLTRHSTG